jgi:hypothetical protein
MALYASMPRVAPCETASLHIKSVCRLFSQADEGRAAGVADVGSSSTKEEEHLPWFMLTSACLSKGAQGQPTPYRDPQSDQMSYSNFELGVLFASRLVGDRLNDRLYASSAGPARHGGGCRCARWKGKDRWYKPHKLGTLDDLLSDDGFVKKIHLPIPYELRPRPYQDDPDTDFMSATPYMNEIPDGTGCVGNMKLTPLGQQIARDAEDG